MQYGLRIIFDTQLSHKTGKSILDCGFKAGLLNVDFGMGEVEYVLKRGAQGLRLKNDFPLFCLEP